MKLFYVANVRLPTERAHGIQIMKMCEAFARGVVEVELVVPKRRTHIKGDLFQYYAVEKIFKITKLFSLDLVWLGYIGFWIQSFSFVLSVLLNTLHKSIDCVYSRYELPLFFLSFFKKKNIVWEVHMPRYNLIVQVLVKRAKKIIVISQGLKDFYIGKGVPPERLLVAHDGVDLEEFSVAAEKKEIRRRLGLPEGKPI